MKRYLLTTLLAIFLTGALIGGSWYFSVREVVIEGVSDLTGLEGYSGAFLPLLKEKDIEAAVSTSNPTLAEVHVYKQYPYTLYITARELRPVVTVKLSDGYMYVSEVGTVLGKNRSDDDSSLPVLTYYQPLFFNQTPIGSIVDHAEIVTAALMTHKVLDLGIAVTKIDITNENMIVLHTDSFTLLVTSIKDVQQQLRILDYTYKQLRREGKEFTSIDVRFEKPIIKL
jgi:cell division septal protein FtsQ